MPKFKIIKGEGLEATIEKSEHKPTKFEVKNVVEHIGAVDKAIKETEAKIGLEKAIIANISKQHPQVLKINEQVRQACYLFMKSKLAIVPVQDQLDKLKDSMKEYEEELNELKDQTGIDIWKKKK